MSKLTSLEEVFIAKYLHYWILVVPQHGGNIGIKYYQKLMNRHSKKEHLASVPILCRITLQNTPYKGLIHSCCRLNLLLRIVLLWILTRNMIPARLLNKVGANMLLTMFFSLTLLCSVSGAPDNAKHALCVVSFPGFSGTQTCGENLVSLSCDMM